MGCVDNPVIEDVGPPSGYVGDFVELAGVWRTGADVRARCNWWFNGKAYKLYQPAEMTSHGSYSSILCPVPARGAGMSQSPSSLVSQQAMRARPGCQSERGLLDARSQLVRSSALVATRFAGGVSST